MAVLTAVFLAVDVPVVGTFWHFPPDDIELQLLCPFLHVPPEDGQLAAEAAIATVPIRAVASRMVLNLFIVRHLFCFSSRPGPLGTCKNAVKIINNIYRVNSNNR